jgi:uncharacterized protein YutE (UPF0331/DUF86 family)
MIDPALVIRKIKLISSDLKEIIKLSRKTERKFLEDPYAEVLAERFLERTIGRMIDINFHLITELGHPPPSDYFESFVKLGRIEILPPKLANQLASCAGLRNHIAHEYDEIDPVKVYEGLRAAAKDIPLYLRHIQTYLDSLPKV